MAPRHSLTGQLALSMLASEGIAVIWQLQVAATDAHRTARLQTAVSILETPKQRRQPGSGPRSASPCGLVASGECRLGSAINCKKSTVCSVMTDDHQPDWRTSARGSGA